MSPRAYPSEPVRMEQTGRSGFSPGEAFGIGLVATAAPMFIAASAGSGSHGNPYDRSGWITLGAVAGLVVGPAVGLASGGRGDLAGRGVLMRVAGLGIFSLGVLGAAYSYGSGSEGPGAGALALGVGGGVLTIGSAMYDLVRTPSAVAEGQRPRAALGVRPDGKLAVSVTF